MSASDNEMFFDCIDSEEGNSFRAWENLKDMYEPRNVRAKIDLLNEFRGRNLNIGEDPDEWISELTRIKLKLKNLFNEIITDKDFIVNIINGLNRQYSQVQGILEYQLESKSDPLTVEIIKVHLRARFNRIKKSSGETALNTRRSNTVFWKCGKVGHISRFCDQDNDNKRTSMNRSEKYCTRCKKHDHLVSYCWMKDEDEKMSGESGNLVNDSCNRIVLIGSDTDRDVIDEWICDSGATHHITNDPMMMYNVKKSGDSVRIGDGEMLKISWIGDIDFNIRNDDDSNTKITLKDVSYIPGFWCNLFSLTLSLKSGMKVENDGMIIRLKKGNKRIDFSRFFKSKKGYLCGMN